MASELPSSRDHLANERTFLAWIRTSVTFSGLGFVIVKFSLFIEELSMLVERSSPPQARDHYPIIGVAIVGIGLLLAVFAYFEYRRVRRILISSVYAPSTALPFLTTLILTIVGIMLISYLLLTI